MLFYDVSRHLYRCYGENHPFLWRISIWIVEAVYLPLSPSGPIECAMSLIPSLVSVGASSCISTRPSSISLFRSSGLIGDHFVRLALISRSAQRRRIAVSISNPASGELGCSDMVAYRPSVFIALASNTASSLIGWSTEGGGNVSASAEMGEPSLNRS